MTNRNSFIKLLSLAVLLAISQITWAQDIYEQEFKVPLSSPGKPGKLSVGLHNGTITVEGYNGNEVIVAVKAFGGKKSSGQKERAGLKRIPNSATNFKIVEEDNEIVVRGGHNSRTDFVIRVPRQFDLSLSSHHNGDIKVMNVVGIHEIDTHHGGMELTDIGGAVIADTHHGEIKATFTSVTPNKPMAFSTYHGDVEVSFPSNMNCSTKVKSTKGDIYTDFDLELSAGAPEQKRDDSGTSIKLGGWLYGDIGSGGPEFMFNTYHGDVVIRKK